MAETGSAGKDCVVRNTEVADEDIGEEVGRYRCSRCIVVILHRSVAATVICVNDVLLILPVTYDGGVAGEGIHFPYGCLSVGKDGARQ